MLTLGSRIAVATTVYVAPAKATGTEDSETLAEVYSELVKSYVEAYDDELSLTDKKTDAQVTLHPKIIQTGESFFIFLKLDTLITDI